MPVQSIDIQTADGTMDAKLFSPEGQGPWPGVVMISDAGGTRPAFEAMAQRLASEGYVVLLPHVYYREGRAPLLGQGSMADESFRQRVFALLATLTPERILTDAAAEVGLLTSRPEVKKGGIGVVGYCMGGAVAMRMMAGFPEQVAAAASYHGGHRPRMTRGARTCSRTSSGASSISATPTRMSSWRPRPSPGWRRR
ncbi:dienelactone hydrolase family protein [Cystobacter fuscus]